MIIILLLKCPDPSQHGLDRLGIREYASVPVKNSHSVSVGNKYSVIPVTAADMKLCRLCKRICKASDTVRVIIFVNGPEFVDIYRDTVCDETVVELHKPLVDGTGRFT